jgi:GcrA cell cycle regulator
MTDAAGTWTDERVEILKKLWADGLSASQIAAEIGGVTRNAVIGKVHRLGLSGRAQSKGSNTQRPRKATRAPSAPVSIARPLRQALPLNSAPVIEAEEPEEISIDTDDDVLIPFSERVTIMDLREFMCRWPMGDPTKPEFRFCGARSSAGLPYCAHHARIAYQPVADRKRDRRLARA